MTPVRSMTAPASARTRAPRYPFTPAEVKEAVKMLKDGKTPGVGPYENENQDKALQEARSAIQSLKRHVMQVWPDANLGTRAWLDPEVQGNEASALLYVKD